MNDIPAILGGPRAVQRNIPHWPRVSDEIIAAVVNALKGGQMSETADIGFNAELEDVFKQYHGVAYAMAVNSGTAALDSAVFAAGVGPGDEVITSPLCPGYVVTPILHFNGIPVFADVDPHTGCIDPNEIEKHITNATRAIMVVHLNGHPADMEPIMEIAEKHRLKVIEDCAHAQGSMYKGKRIGAIGHISAFSLQSVKNLPCGEGGIVLTNDREMYERACLVGQHPVRLDQCLTMEKYRRYIETGMGWNFRIHILAAAIGVEQMKHFDEVISLRIASADRINRALEAVPGVKGTYVAPDCTHTYYAQMLTCDPQELDGLPVETFVNALAEENVPGVDLFEPPVNDFAIFKDKKFYDKGCPWNCRHGNERSYKNLSFPNVDSVRASSVMIGLPGGFVTSDTAAIDEIIHAIQKVAAHAAEIRKTLESPPNNRT